MASRIRSKRLLNSFLAGAAVIYGASAIPEARADTITSLYDDFSGNSLDASKWEITCGDVLGCLPFAGINPATHQFEMLQEVPHGIGQATATYLNLIGNEFSIGDQLSFDFNYNGSGNQVAGFQYDSYPPAPCFSCIGYWNGVVGDGNMQGLYHFNLSFLDNKSYQIDITKPDNTTISRISTYATDQPHFYTSVATGHDGILRASYDNFYITRNSEPVPEPSTLVLTLSGIGLAGLTLLRRRK
jgi:hypothetical protein